MPYDVFMTGPDDKPYCVHKHDEDGEPVGKPLGCHATREAAEVQLSALYANEGDAKVVHSGWTKAHYKRLRTLEVLGVPYGGPDNGKDKQGEYFSPRTDIMLKPGDKRPVIYNHGLDPDNHAEIHPKVIGEAEYIGARTDGHWFRVEIEDAIEEADRIVKAAMSGLARASSGAINYLTRTLRRTGEILVWPLAELTLIDYEAGKREPANDYAVATLKAVFDEAKLELPEVLAEADKAEVQARRDECGCTVRVDPFYLVEARRLRS